LKGARFPSLLRGIKKGGVGKRPRSCREQKQKGKPARPSSLGGAGASKGPSVLPGQTATGQFFSKPQNTIYSEGDPESRILNARKKSQKRHGGSDIGRSQGKDPIAIAISKLKSQTKMGEEPSRINCVGGGDQKRKRTGAAKRGAGGWGVPCPDQRACARSPRPTIAPRSKKRRRQRMLCK